jgi:hypothetical protein
MRRMIFIGALLALLVLPSAASAAATPGDRARAVRDCMALKSTMKDAAFRQTFGRPHAFARCVRKMTAEEAENRALVVAECRAEREADPEAFRDEYGVGPGKRGAFGQCVAEKRRAESRADRADIRNGVRACRGERDDWGTEAFRDEYGTGESGRNAFGRCVAQKAREADEGSGPV